MKKLRDSNLELLRIIAMFLIVLHHAIVHGVFGNISAYNTQDLSSHFLNFTISNILISGGKVSVAVFVMITGYFSVKSTFNYKRLIPIIMQTFFYSIVGLILGVFFIKNISIILIIQQFFPIIYSQYWFITAYVALYIFSPFLVFCLNSLNQKSHFILCLLLIVVNTIIPTFFPKSLTVITNEFFCFILFFTCGYCIKIYEEKFLLNKQKGIKLLLVTILLYITSVLFLEILMVFSKINLLSKIYYFSNLNSPLTLLCAISLLIIFKEINLKNNTIINNISRLTLGIYLIHDNVFMRKIIWSNIFRLNTIISENTLLLVSKVFFSVCLVFICSILIEFLRSSVFSRLENKIINKKIDPIFFKKLFIKFKGAN